MTLSNPTIVKEENTFVVLKVTCKFCKKDHEIMVTKEGYRNWHSGMLIQKAFPRMTPDNRELLISAICGKCWINVFGPDDEEDE